MNTYNTFAIQGGNKLKGKIKIQASKNAFLPILAASLLCDETVTLKNCPKITDIEKMQKILTCSNVKVSKHKQNLKIDARNARQFAIPDELSKAMRSSIFLMGAMLTRFKKVILSYPGGCAIGARPIDLHIKAFKDLNIDVIELENDIICSSENIKPTTIEFAKKSVGATENVILATVKTKGTTIIKNCAKEPEVIDLINFLNSMGAQIAGAGTDTIIINGVDYLHATDYTPISDRIVAGTYLIAVAAAGGNVMLENVKAEHNLKLIEILKCMGCKINILKNKINIECSKRLKAYKSIETAPYPDFPTDLQSQMLSLLSISDGKSEIVEHIFENRFKNINELIKMGAIIIQNEQKALIKGVSTLKGTFVECYDLRGGAGLVIAGLAATGTTYVKGISFIDRGYESIDNDLNHLGAKITRLK